MVDLDAMQQYVEVKWDEKIYKLRQLAVEEKNLVKKITQVTAENSLEIAKEVLDFLCERFKETKVPFDEKKFRVTATFGMINETMRVLMSGDKSKTG